MARQLRKNMTPEEKHLWYDFLKKLPMSVKRQKNIGNFILDFYIPSARIAIEIDGLQHTAPEHIQKDEARDRVLLELGIVVCRYSNEDINKRFLVVCEDILEKLGLTATDISDEE